jgi:hypothetical protein
MVRGGSSPLGRIEKALLSGPFVCIEGAADVQAARAFEAGLQEVPPRERRSARTRPAGGVYPYPTKGGTRWYFKARDSAGRQATNRGFTSERSARNAKRRLVEKVERGEVRHTRESFGHFWDRWLTRRKPYLEPATWRGYEINGRKRLLPECVRTDLGAAPRFANPLLFAHTAQPPTHAMA